MDSIVRDDYAISAKLDIPYEEAVEKTKAALKEQGFGVLTEIDVKKVMKEKLGEDFRRYVILGACNPQLAHRALEAELAIGVLLPCNVIVYEEDGGSIVAAQDPEAALSIVGNLAVAPIAEEASERLRTVIGALAG